MFMMSISQAETESSWVSNGLQRGASANHLDWFDGVSRVFQQRYYPQAGWTEHDPNEILQSAIFCSESAMKKAGAKSEDIAGISH